MANFQPTPCYSPRFVAALGYAADIHAFQVRKQGNVPYVSHLLQVASMVMEAGGTEDEAIAALLHDAIEDAIGNPDSPTYQPRSVIMHGNATGHEFVVAESFGWEVADLVTWCSAESNELYVQNMQKAPASAILISAADKLHNLRSYATTGRHLWKPAHAEFYAQLMSIYEGCDRVPRHWIDEMRQLLAGMQQPMITISLAEYNYLS